uniref:B30.2/SPRY domain-containing protein n=1 Tax=Lepisosteus oculatus TaxID=7918 RepID=W5N8V3_LEPOC
PRIHIDSKQVLSCQTAAAALKHFLGDLLEQPVEGRPQLLRPGLQERRAPGVGNPSLPLGGDSTEMQIPHQSKVQRKSNQERNPHQASSHKDPGTQQNPTAAAPQKHACDINHSKHLPPSALSSSADYLTKDPPLSNPVAARRSDLLQHATVLTLDLRTAHRRLVLSENFTRAAVSEEQTSYPDSPARFSMCSQVLCFKGFSRGRHYWEVKLTSSNFCAVGLAYNSIARKGPSSRLGRNKQSWCLEWFNVKLSAWHDSAETVLFNPSPSRVGVLLDCDEGTATFYNVADR